MEKIKVSQDELRIFLRGCHFINAALARKMGVTEGIVSGCFHHKLNRHGKPLSFSKKNIELMNVALQQISKDLIECKLKFAKDEDSSSKRFIDDSPAVVESMRKISEYIKLSGLTNKALGWDKRKCDYNINLKANNPRVHLSKEDADRINAELLAVAGALSSYEVVGDASGNGGTQAADGKEDNKGKRTRMEQSFESKAQPWDDVSLTLQERTRLVRERWPNGILFFRVNGGYTVEGDDARFAESIDGRISPYTDAASGLTTAYMDEEVLQSVLPKMVSQDKRIVFTDMY